MNCATLQSLLPYISRPEEIGADEWDEIQTHIAQCNSCRRLVESEGAFDRALTRALNAVEVPPRLHGEILCALSRRSRRQMWYRRVQWSTGVAAVVLFAAVLWRWYSAGPVVEPGLWAHWEDQQYVLISNGSRESAIEFFRSRGLKTFVPTDFDYSLLTHLEVVDVEGRPVASMTFKKGDNRAKVYVIPRGRFRIAPLPAPLATGSHCSVEMWEVSRDYVLVVVYFGEADRQLFFQAGLIG